MSIDATTATSTNSYHVLNKLISTRRVVAGGYLVVASFILIFGLWGSTTPLTQAAVSPGVVGVEGQKKVVQHLDGGIVDIIHVRNGDRVSQGQPLLTLNRTEIESRHNEYLYQRMQLSAELARWQAELAGEKNITFPEWLLTHPQSDEAMQAMQTQQSTMITRQEVVQATLERMELQRAVAFEEEQAAQQKLQNQLARRSLVNRELAEQRDLEQAGLTTRSRVFDLEKVAAELTLEIDEARALISVSQRRRVQVESEILELLRMRTQEAAENSNNVARELSRITQLHRTARAELERTQLSAPVDGYVVNSQLNTVGGVITAGQRLMEIMPAGEELLIESRIDAADRDTVRVGQSAQVRFTALNRRATPPVEGVVRIISADRTVDPITQQTYYNTSIELLEDPSIALSGTEIYPGMLADVLIVTGEQTLLQYLLSPVLRSFDKALREN